MLPLRLLSAGAGFLAFMLSTSTIALFPNGRLKAYLNNTVMRTCYWAMAKSFSARINFHDVENKTRKGGICVANHTSPLDVCMLSSDGTYALTGQRHGGFLGLLQVLMSLSGSHIWFERSEVKDRARVVRRMREHIADTTKPPILIFPGGLFEIVIVTSVEFSSFHLPEGTCINNTSVMQFKKGAFEIGQTVHPIAVKYDSRFGEMFWYVHTCATFVTLNTEKL